MEPGIADLLPPLPLKPRVLRVLWRMQGPSRVIVARIERHPAGLELIIAFDASEDDVIETRFERFECAPLERRAEALRQLLQEKGWVAIKA
jgi:hypothetical protein